MGSGTTHDTSIAIAASREAVWRVLSAVEAWPGWLPTVTRVEPLDGAPLRPGARYTISQPKLRPATWVVTHLEAPRRFAWESRAPGFHACADHLIDEPSPGQARVTLRMTFAGILAVPASWFLRTLTEDYLAREAAALKRTVERAVSNDA